MNLTRPLLERLLRVAQRARVRGDTRPVTLRMTPARAQEYFALRSLAERERFHAEIALAEREGAVLATRELHRGDGSQLLRLGVCDIDALARLLGLVPLHLRLDAARERLQPWLPRFPVLDRVMEAWCAERRVRGHGPEAADDLAQAASIVAARSDDTCTERILRRESARLCGDSKRIEALTAWLELLLSGDLGHSGLEREQVWALLGLRREPQPLLLAGNGTVELVDGGTVPLVRPYLGLPAHVVLGLDTPAHALLTIENLTSFHEAAMLQEQSGVLLVYTGGMPSPAWRAAWLRLLRRLPAGAEVFHWGDIDVGGFRIAALLARTAREADIDLRPWCMSPRELPAALIRDLPAAPRASVDSMQASAAAAGWPEIAGDLAAHPVQVEQEHLAVRLPTPQTLRGATPRRDASR